MVNLLVASIHSGPFLWPLIIIRIIIIVYTVRDISAPPFRRHRIGADRFRARTSRRWDISAPAFRRRAFRRGNER